MIKIDTRDIERLESDLKTFAHRAYPFATKNTVNQSARKAMTIAREDVAMDMTLRNRFTIQSIQFEQTRTLAVSRQAATVGSIADYMEDQEFGAVKVKRGSKGVAIATSYSTGQSDNESPRTKLPRRANKMSSIRLRKNKRGGSTRRQRNLIAVRQAAASSQKYVFLDLGRRQGIFKVTGGKRRPRVKMVHDLTRKSVVIPKNPWLDPAVKKTEAFIPEIYRDSLIFQTKRLQLFK